MKSGMLFADALIPKLLSDSPSEPLEELKDYEALMESSWIYDELKIVRNSHASFRWGLFATMVHTAFSCFLSSKIDLLALKFSIK